MNDKITTPQTIVLIITTLIGVWITTLPATLAEKSGPDSWLMVIIGGGISVLGAAIVTSTGRQFPEKTFIEYSVETLGVFGHLFNLGLIIYLVILTGMVVRIFGEVIKVFLLDRTPIEVIILTMLALCVYLTRHGIEPIARTAEVLLPILMLPVIIIYLMIILFNGDLSNFMPFLRLDFKEIIAGTKATVVSFLGFEVLLLFIPLMQNPHQSTYSSFVAILMVSILYLFVVVTVIAVLGIVETSLLIWPGISVLRMTETAGTVFPRMDVVILSLWSIAGFTTISPMLFASAFGISRILKAREFKSFIVPLVPVAYMIAMFPKDVLEARKAVEAVSNMGLFYIFVVPLLILTAHWIRRRVLNR